MERELRSKERSNWRNRMRSGHPGSCEYPQRHDGAHLDQHLHRRPLSGVSSRLVDPIVDCTSQQRGESRRNHQLLQPAFRHRRANHHRLSGRRSTIVRVGLWNIGDLLIDRHRSLHFSAGQNRTYARRIANHCLEHRRSLATKTAASPSHAWRRSIFRHRPEGSDR
jgi:hypothetical protein